MARKSQKTKTDVVGAFKGEPALAELLDKLPNKSAFIRKAIAAQLGAGCPLCHGKGVVPRGVYEHYTPLLAQFNSRNCDSCGNTLNVPLDEGGLDPENRSRLEQFFLGGPFYCDT